MDKNLTKNCCGNMRNNLLVAAFLLFSIASFAQVNLSQGLMAYYPFNGNANDSSGNGNNPVFNNATLTTDRFGNANSAYLFNGSNSYMQIKNAASLNSTTAITISMWVKVNGFYSGACQVNSIMQKNDATTNGFGAYNMIFSPTGYNNGQSCSLPLDTVHQNFYGATCCGNGNPYQPYVQKNQWYHILYTLGNDTSKLYINNVLKFQHFESGFSGFTNTADLLFGKGNNSAYPFWFNGVLDDIRIYNRVLNTREATTLYTDSSAVNLNTGLMAYYPFTGNANDSSGNNNNPVFNNAILTPDRFGKPNSAYLFDGSSSYMRITGNTTLNSSKTLSICHWIKVNGFYQGNCHANYIVGTGVDEDNNNRFVSYLVDAPYTNNTHCFGLAPDTLHESYAAPGVITSAKGPFVQKGTWVYCVITCDGKTAKYYLNGTLIAQNVDSISTFLTSPHDLYIGRYPTLVTSTPYWFNGVIDDIRIYNRALNQAEVTSLYNATFCPTNASQLAVTETTSSALFNSYKISNQPGAGVETSKGELAMFAWSANSIGLPYYNGRTLTTIDLTSIPKNAKINSANLYLYAKTTGATNGVIGQPTYGTKNAVLVQKITSNWSPITLSWINTPNIDTTTQKTLPQSTSTAQDYTLDISDFAQKWVSTPDSNFGMMLKMQTENNPYNSMVFEAAQASDSNRRARLEICYSLPTTLPSTIKYFAAHTITSPYTSLYIATTNEINTASIVIERSYDGIEFENAATLAAKGNATINEYSYIDKVSPTATKVYYHLRLIDKDGSYKYSNIISIVVDQAIGFKSISAEVSPNPVRNGNMNLSLYLAKDELVTIRVVDANGKMVAQQKAQAAKGLTALNLPAFKSLPVGVYTVIIATNSDTINKKVVKID
ncbi:LamG-like jellyroll fold domain-containing protein [Parasediminibacterium sp. JCM 36343]|uniref:LamG-like jellyroll fold domain-containing protein n=1 Tax=Parasediminibacterium sp. JCM 36343 TaxID=3374279 RepID=UPI00397C914A